jgi:hypothetical protein
MASPHLSQVDRSSYDRSMIELLLADEQQIRHESYLERTIRALTKSPSTASSVSLIFILHSSLSLL